MFFGWWKRWRRARLARSPLPAAWVEYLDEVPLYRWLSAEEQRQLQRIVHVLIAEKHWEGCGGQVVDDRVKVVIAAQAALLVLRFGDVYFDRTPTILVYPDAYVAPYRKDLAGGVSLEGWDERSGEAWYRGPVVLAWSEVTGALTGETGGRNIVLHEFAHQLDMLDGTADGVPPMADGNQRRRWCRCCRHALQSMRRSLAAGECVWLDEYAATSAAEFFAVVSEAFWMQPRQLRLWHAELYDLWRDYFRQDPAERPGWDAPF
ncbi:MAG: hypothetical protein KatS3mg110_1726 [Pirellulaceae bacterium]|nr:MAG: hypothetical protein KatS3mg110_1726 [Pirellulaceae bacterium]